MPKPTAEKIAKTKALPGGDKIVQEVENTNVLQPMNREARNIASYERQLKHDDAAAKLASLTREVLESNVYFVLDGQIEGNRVYIGNQDGHRESTNAHDMVAKLDEYAESLKADGIHATIEWKDISGRTIFTA